MGARIKGRGSSGCLPGRFEACVTRVVDDGWHGIEEEEFAAVLPRIQVREEIARRIISRNSSPEIGFSQSINSYRGREHGCSCCFARPSHAWLGLSAGLDFETRILATTHAPARLRCELARAGDPPSPIALGINPDACEPIEHTLQLTRRIIEVLAKARHRFSLITRNALVTRDLGRFAPLARDNLVDVRFSETSLDPRLSVALEPRASAPHPRLRAINALRDAGVPDGLMVAPVIRWVNDSELEAVPEAVHGAGAESASYVVLRLPHESLAPVPRPSADPSAGARRARHERAAATARAGRVCRLPERRFALALRPIGFSPRAPRGLDCSRFIAPRLPSPQGELF